MSVKIVLARVDKRLLHATVTLNWDRFIKVDYVAVVGSDYENNPFMTSVMQLCLPKSMKVKIFTEEELVDFIGQKDEFGRPVRLLVIFKDLASAVKSTKLGFHVEELQLPYPVVSVASKNLSDYFNEEEMQQIAYLQSRGIRLYFQTTPYEAKDYKSFCR